MVISGRYSIATYRFEERFQVFELVVCANMLHLGWASGERWQRRGQRASEAVPHSRPPAGGSRHVGAVRIIRRAQLDKRVDTRGPIPFLGVEVESCDPFCWEYCTGQRGLRLELPPPPRVALRIQAFCGAKDRLAPQARPARSLRAIQRATPLRLLGLKGAELELDGRSR